MPKNSKVKVKVSGLSGFDKSFHNLLSAKCGTLVPILTDMVIPGQKVRLNYGLSATMPPLASDTYGKMSIRTEAFFVPMRLLSGSFEDFFTQQNVSNGVVADDSLKGACPAFYFSAAQDLNSPFMKPGSLPDYLGYRIDHSTQGQSLNSLYHTFSLMPFLAYHRIYDDWYKNGYVQKDVFIRPITSSESLPYIKHAPFYSFRDSAYLYPVSSSGVLLNPGFSGSLGNFDDRVSIFALRQRNFGDDYFTLARPNAQFGDAMSVGAPIDFLNNGQSSLTIGQDESFTGEEFFDNIAQQASFTISALRAANSLQQYKERKNLANTQYVDQIFAQYGVRPSDGVAQRAILLGVAEHEVYSKGVYQTSNTDGSSSTQNPFSGSVAAEYGSARASGVTNDFVSFEAKEPGYIMVLASLVPRVSYSSGIRRMLTYFGDHSTIVDLPNHLLQNTGNQPIYNFELNRSLNKVAQFTNPIFGYVQRYADFMTHEDEIHGLFRDSQNLDSFALQRSFASNADTSISDNFLQIPTTYLDQVAAVSGSISGFGYWLDIHFDYKIVAPLEQYSLPSLQDPAYEHGRDITVDTRGSNL